MQYTEALIEAIKYWNSGLIEDEWFFENFRKKFINRMTPFEAFSSIDDTIFFLVRENDNATACEILQTIINLAHRSQTTEIPTALSDEKKSLDAKFSSGDDYLKSKYDELLKYYRLSNN